MLLLTVFIKFINVNCARVFVINDRILVLANRRCGCQISESLFLSVSGDSVKILSVTRTFLFLFFVFDNNDNNKKGDFYSVHL